MFEYEDRLYLHIHIHIRSYVAPGLFCAQIILRNDQASCHRIARIYVPSLMLENTANDLTISAQDPLSLLYFTEVKG